jgi:predicted metal-binding membrane protein
VRPVLAVPVLLRQRVLLGIVLAAVIALSWAYLVWMAADGHDPSVAHCAAMAGATSSSAGYVGWLFVMWAVMAVAMMLPTALPVVVLYARFHRGRHRDRDPVPPTLSLAAGYLLAWFLFGAAAALLQWELERAGLALPGLGQLRSARVGGLVLAGAGLFQLSPLKAVCLSKCRTPLGFLMTRWREGDGGALRMGVEHGLHCLGCCWALMLVMFVAGVMNLAWMALLTLLMLLEKVAPRGDLVGRLAGVGLIVAGAVRLLY